MTFSFLQSLLKERSRGRPLHYQYKMASWSFTVDLALSCHSGDVAVAPEARRASHGRITGIRYPRRAIRKEYGPAHAQ